MYVIPDFFFSQQHLCTWWPDPPIWKGSLSQAPKSSWRSDLQRFGLTDTPSAMAPPVPSHLSGAG